ncbi:MAG: hypothetical protein CVV37_02725 [Nitrospira bacterium HGW-Nitrospira-1]|nr:MAG: hypothetical protein CVV37_02725 [Nitrospira bacterium HGW-Nitrospira-1]
MPNVRGKSLKALTMDVSEGYIAVNPLFLKLFEPEQLKEFYRELSKTQNDIRGERFPTNDLTSIRTRNLKLQRLHSTAMIVRNFARERKILLV